MLLLTVNTDSMSKFKVTIGSHKTRPFINIYYDKIRYRYWNGESINLKIKCIDNPLLLKSAFELKLREGWKPKVIFNKMGKELISIYLNTISDCNGLHDLIKQNIRCFVNNSEECFK